MLLRPLTHDDVPAWCDLKAAVEAVERTGEHYSAADLHEELDHDGYEALGAFDGDLLVGEGHLLPRGESEGRFKIAVGGATLPARHGEGIGTTTLGALLARADALHAAQRPDLEAKVTAVGLVETVERRDLLADAGFVEDRWSFGMRTTLATVAEPPSLPEGYVVRACDDDLAVRMRVAHNAAFTGHHPGFVPWSERMWQQHVTEASSFRRDVSLVALTGPGHTEIAGYVQSAEWDAYFDATGRKEAYVGKVGVVPGHRGRGLAGALLGHALVAYRDAGYDEAALDVDSHNPTGALGIYERAGFEVETRWVSCALIRPALR